MIEQLPADNVSAGMIIGGAYPGELRRSFRLLDRDKWTVVYSMTIGSIRQRYISRKKKQHVMDLRQFHAISSDSRES